MGRAMNSANNQLFNPQMQESFNQILGRVMAKTTHAVMLQEKCVLTTNCPQDAQLVFLHTKAKNPGALVYLVEYTTTPNPKTREPIVNIKMRQCTQHSQTVPLLNKHYKQPIPQPTQGTKNAN